jgi:acetyl esterase/lipase
MKIYHIKPSGSLVAILFFILMSNQLLAQTNCEERYKSRVFNSIQVFRDVVYSQDAPSLLAASLGTETTYNQDLVMDIFMPPPTDTVSNRPLVILAHGGGFINVAFMGGTVLVGTKDNDDVQALADSLAHWGFVTASIQYRVGFDVLSGTSIKRAVWRGAQDMSAAIRFFRKNAQWFDIDPNRLFIGGSSAGAFCAIHSTFVDSDERIPESFQQNILAADLGEMHSRPVVELTGFNPFTGSNVLADDVDSIPQGVVAYWGAIADTDMLSGNNKAPMRMFHGDADPIVSSQCAKPFSNVILVAPVTCGSEIMDSVMNVLGMPHQTTIQPGEGHEYWGVLNGLWTTTGPNAYWKPMIDETADYFYEIMRPTAPTINGPTAVLPQTNYSYSVQNPNPNSTYCWDIGGGLIVSPDPTASTVDVQFFSGTTIGIINVQEIDAADVASEQAQHLAAVSNSTATNVAEESKPELIFYPSPVRDYLQIELEHSTTKEWSIEVFNLQGQLLYQQNSFEPQHRIHTADWNNGIYLLRVQNKEFSWTEKFQIMR